jgi:hypothetical protein
MGDENLVVGPRLRWASLRAWVNTPRLNSMHHYVMQMVENIYLPICVICGHLRPIEIPGRILYPARRCARGASDTLPY